MALVSSGTTVGSSGALRQSIAEETIESSDFDPAPDRGAKSYAEIWDLISDNRQIFLLVVGGLLTACAVYCLIAPNVFESKARVALRSAPRSALDLDRGQRAPSGALAGAR